ncbi:TrbC/VirB2 family protein [Sphingomonas sp.]|uniref:TrbC/VirB2 family protein n=1 Tax=Sphingomonas sp. TaxID=28214 RepID=UPI002ED9081B
MGASPLLAAVSWLQGTILGTVATSIALIAVASIGLMMLSGRMPLRRGATVLLGCFILFGASSIAAGIQAMATLAGDAARQYPAPRGGNAGSPPHASPQPSPAPGYDPYAGASVPQR